LIDDDLEKMWQENIVVSLFSVEVVSGRAEHYSTEARRAEVKT
jgi:hypothetical protein